MYVNRVTREGNRPVDHESTFGLMHGARLETAKETGRG